MGERERLAEAGGTGGEWRTWGPWLAERAWGTVREDYSPGGDAWTWLSHEDARSTAYRWNEDGIAGICDDQQRACLAFAFWNGHDPILKDRMFGLTNSEGNHGEDVKEEFFFVDATPTASWLVYRYRYPQVAFPYEDLVAENHRRGREDREYELADTGALDGCWEIEIRWAKSIATDLVGEVRVTNTGTAQASLHVLPTLWARNTWSWAEDATVPTIVLAGGALVMQHHVLGTVTVSTDDAAATPVFCDNDTNMSKRYGVAGAAYPKDGINDHVVGGLATVNLASTGTKAALWSQLTVAAGATETLTVRLTQGEVKPVAAQVVLAARQAEADEFHASLLPAGSDPDRARVVRQALAGLVWGQCFYHYDVAVWLDGDPAGPTPPSQRLDERNSGWRHLNSRDVISMPDAWEYPWFASWDLAFHTVAIAEADPIFAQSQLLLLFREWYAHPSGAVPAYEWDFGDVNPPVQAWAALQVARVSPPETRHDFLQRAFHKLMLQFTWWINRIDRNGNNLFEGGFLGLDNVGPFDRTHQPPGIGELEQSDGTAWTAMLCLDLLEMALTLALEDSAYEDVATKFFEHFTLIASAMESSGLWNEEDGFFYDLLLRPDGSQVPMKVRSVAGLVSIAAVRVISEETLAALPAFAARMEWFLEHQPLRSSCVHATQGKGRLLSLLPPDRLVRILKPVLDESELLSAHGLRSVSKYYEEHPYVVPLPGNPFPPLDYEPGESRSGLFGGNSNWRGPVWFPLNLLCVTGLRRYAAYFGDDLTVECPTGSGTMLALGGVASELSNRLVSLFTPSADGSIPAAGDGSWPQGLLQFNEYFHGDTGRGLGASHQTGWTATVLNLVLDEERKRTEKPC